MSDTITLSSPEIWYSNAVLRPHIEEGLQREGAEAAAYEVCLHGSPESLFLTIHFPADLAKGFISELRDSQKLGKALADALSTPEASYGLHKLVRVISNASQTQKQTNRELSIEIETTNPKTLVRFLLPDDPETRDRAVAKVISSLGRLRLMPGMNQTIRWIHDDPGERAGWSMSWAESRRNRDDAWWPSIDEELHPSLLNDESESAEETEEDLDEHPTDAVSVRTVRDFVAIAAVSAAFVLSILSLLWPWGSSTANRSAGDLPSVWLHLAPLCFVLAVATVMVWSRAMRSTVFNICVLASAWWVAYLLADVVSTIQHHATLGLGAKLALAGAAAAAVSAVLLRRPSLTVSPSGLIWGASFFVCAVAWVIGFWRAWTATALHIGIPGTTPHATHTYDLTLTCCTAFGSGYTFQEKLGSGLEMGIVLVAAIVLALCVPGWIAGASVIVLGILYFGDPLSWIYTIAHNHPNPATVGVAGLTAARVAQYHVTATVTALIGGWLALTASLGLIVLGVFRVLASFIHSPTPAA